MWTHTHTGKRTCAFTQMYACMYTNTYTLTKTDTGESCQVTWELIQPQSGTGFQLINSGAGYSRQLKHHQHTLNTMSHSGRNMVKGSFTFFEFVIEPGLTFHSQDGLCYLTSLSVSEHFFFQNIMVFLIYSTIALYYMWSLDMSPFRNISVNTCCCARPL